MAGGAETPNIEALPAIARLGTCESAQGPDADRHVKLLIQFAVEGHSRALIHGQEPTEALAERVTRLKEKLTKVKEAMGKLAVHERQMLASPTSGSP
jgi:hypothetical protein